MINDRTSFTQMEVAKAFNVFIEKYLRNLIHYTRRIQSETEILNSYFIYNYTLV